MRHTILYLFLLFPLLLQSQTKFSTSKFDIQIDKTGHLTSLYDRTEKTEYLSGDTTAALLTIQSAGQMERPAASNWDRKAKQLQLQYPRTGIQVNIAVSEKQQHLVFEILYAEPANKIDAVVWGPYPTTISQTIGEIVGVVRNDRFAIGIQALNPETTGGLFLNNEGMVDGRGSAAWKARWGSTLQAFALNRDKARQADVWWGLFKNKPVTPILGKTVVGSKIALFGCPEKEALATIGAIEIAEGLPHPKLKGIWVKQSPLAGQSYMISSFAESDVDEMIAAAKRAGLISLYHEGPFKSWGHYQFNTAFFPDGNASVRRCVEKAHAAGLYFGVHTLTNFINTNDPYVSPVPDKRLVLNGSSQLVGPIDSQSTEIRIAAPEYFQPRKRNVLHTVRIGDELIRYREVSVNAPWTLLGCRRGAFGTTATAHTTGAAIGKLMDHPYQIFFPELALQNEIAQKLAYMFNETGVDHLDFDGHEGGLACGQGDYGIDMFAKVFHDKLDHEYLNGTSNSKHFYWHINTYCNWGEPWYGGFRESMQEYRIKNQELFDRNFMPHMLGWYLMTATTSIPEMEWMLARAAGYDAGFAMVIRPTALRQNPIAGPLLDAIREWEAARNAGAFSPEQREQLKNPKQEFHLEKTGEDQWLLYQFHNASPISYNKKELQPGEPTATTFSIKNPDAAQALQFRLEAQGDSGFVHNIMLTLDNYYEISLPVQLAAGEALICDGTPLLRIYDSKGRQRKTLNLPDKLPVLQAGKNALALDADFQGVQLPTLLLTVKTMGKGALVKPQ